MNYTSTRGTVAVNETYALLHGLAEDGGLYVPSLFPTNCLTYNDVKDKNYQEVAAVVLAKLFPCFSEAHLNEMINSAYCDANFSTRDIAPLHSLLEKVSVLELFHGRTQAFKDMALSLFPYLLVAAKEAEGEKKEVLILTATSGDTGKAALEGFKDVPGTHIQVFYPTDGVSPMQAEQMQKQEGENVNVTAIHGNFDDAQSAVKTIFNDEEFKEILKNNNYILSSANSINIGRLLPQIVYYFYSYFDLVKNKHIKLKDKINFTVPTGNFGNILAAYYAKLMGLPVNKLICTSNDNNVLYDFFNSGIYNKNRELILTSSPSMDILISSNLERLLFEISSRDSEKVNNLIKDLNNKGLYKLDTNMKKNLNSFRSEYANELEVKRNINKVFKEYNYLIDTHTCVAYTSYMKYLKKHKDCTPTVIVSTASPYKFSKDVLYSLGEEVNNFDKFEIIEKLSKFSHTEIPYPIKKLKTSLILHDENCEKDEIKSEIKKILKM